MAYGTMLRCIRIQTTQYKLPSQPFSKVRATFVLKWQQRSKWQTDKLQESCVTHTYHKCQPVRYTGGEPPPVCHKSGLHESQGMDRRLSNKRRGKQARSKSHRNGELSHSAASIMRIVRVLLLNTTETEVLHHSVLLWVAIRFVQAMKHVSVGHRCLSRTHCTSTRSTPIYIYTK